MSLPPRVLKVDFALMFLFGLLAGELFLSIIFFINEPESAFEGKINVADLTGYIIVPLLAVYVTYRFQYRYVIDKDKEEAERIAKEGEAKQRRRDKEFFTRRLQIEKDFMVEHCSRCSEWLQTVDNVLQDWCMTQINLIDSGKEDEVSLAPSTEAKIISHVDPSKRGKAYQSIQFVEQIRLDLIDHQEMNALISNSQFDELREQITSEHWAYWNVVNKLMYSIDILTREQIGEYYNESSDTLASLSNSVLRLKLEIMRMDM